MDGEDGNPGAPGIEQLNPSRNSGSGNQGGIVNRYPDAKHSDCLTQCVGKEYTPRQTQLLYMTSVTDTVCIISVMLRVSRKRLYSVVSPVCRTQY